MKNEFSMMVHGIAYSTKQHIGGVRDVEVDVEIKEFRTTTQTVVTINVDGNPSGLAALIRVLSRHDVFISSVGAKNIKVYHNE